MYSEFTDQTSLYNDDNTSLLLFGEQSPQFPWPMTSDKENFNSSVLPPEGPLDGSAYNTDYPQYSELSSNSELKM